MPFAQTVLEDFLKPYQFMGTFQSSSSSSSSYPVIMKGISQKISHNNNNFNLNAYQQNFCSKILSISKVIHSNSTQYTPLYMGKTNYFYNQYLKSGLNFSATPIKIKPANKQVKKAAYDALKRILDVYIT